MALLKTILLFGAVLATVWAAPGREILHADSSYGLGYSYYGLGWPHYALQSHYPYAYAYSYPYGYPYTSSYVNHYRSHGLW